MNLSAKQNNRKQVMAYLREAKTEVPIADIAAATGISKPTIQKILRFYEDRRLVRNAGKGESTEDGGKRPVLYGFNPAFGSVLSVHVGPDFIYGAISDMAAELHHTVFWERRNEDQSKAFSSVAAMIRDFLSHEIVRSSPPVSIVVAMPGIVNPDGGYAVYSPHYRDWEADFPLDDYLRSELDTEIPIYIDCVNRYQAVAEHKRGQAEKVGNFVMIDAMHEGVGAGICVDDRIRKGFQYLAGEVGHMILQPDTGPDCICGGKGCFESLVSVAYIRELMARHTAFRPPRGRTLESLGDQEVAALLFEGVRAGDAASEEILDRIAFWFAMGLNNIIMINDPELVVIEGFYKDAGEGFLQSIRRHLNALGLRQIRKKTRIVFSLFGLERGVLGASVYATERFFSDLFL